MHWAIALFWGGVAMTSASCAHEGNEQAMRDLTEQVQTMQAQLVRYDRRLEQLSNRLLVVSHRVEGEGDVAKPRARKRPPDLEVVRLAPVESPQSAAPQEVAEPEDEEPPIVLEITGSEVKSSRAEQEPSTQPHAATQETAPPSPSEDLVAAGAFRTALGAYRSGNPEGAREQFAKLLARHRSGPYAEGARYWLGVCHFELAHYTDAIGALSDFVERHRGSDKLPDALLKLGVSAMRLGRKSQARNAFLRITREFPSSALADLARGRLASMKGAS